MRRASLGAGVLLITLGWSHASVCRVQFFTEVGVEAGLLPYVPAVGMGSGVACADYDDDGYVDIFVPQGFGAPDRLYHNLGDGTFEEVAALVGLDSLESNRVAAFLDYDGDADLDLFVANDDFTRFSSFVLYRQEATGQFVDVTLEAGVSKPHMVYSLNHHWGGICCGDLNLDGYLDIFTAQFPGPGQLFMNDGDGTFTDLSDTAGVPILQLHHQSIMHDFDRDGLPDIYIAVDFDENDLLINQGDETFVDDAATFGIDSDWNDMGIALGDYDNDGDFDLFITNISRVTPSGEVRHSILYERDDSADPHYTERSVEFGVDDCGWGWGATWLDYDNDGDLDLAATNGWVFEDDAEDPSRFFRNDGGVAFEEISLEVGFEDWFAGSCLLAADFDRDGDLDLLQSTMDGPLRLLDNDASATGENHFLIVQPRMDGANHRAIGAIVRVRVPGATLSRTVSIGTSYLGQEPAEAFFGLGAALSVDWIEVRWPNGDVGFATGIDVDEVLVVHPGDLQYEDAEFRRGDGSDDGVIDLADAISLLTHLFAPLPATILCADAFDVNDDGQLDVADPVHLLTGIFLGGDPPAAPTIDCGIDPTSDELRCLSFAACP